MTTLGADAVEGVLSTVVVPLTVELVLDTVFVCAFAILHQDNHDKKKTTNKIAHNFPVILQSNLLVPRHFLLPMKIFFLMLFLKFAHCEWIWQTDKKEERRSDSQNSISFSDILKGTNFEYSIPVSNEFEFSRQNRPNFVKVF